MENEAASSATVNQLLVLNASDRPLYIMPGEVISGGLQDRTIGEELVIQPAKKPVPIEVYCVEQGRWSGRSITATAQPTTWADDSRADSRPRCILRNRRTKRQVCRPHGQPRQRCPPGGPTEPGPGCGLGCGGRDAWQVSHRSATGNFADVYSEPEIAQEVERYTQGVNPIVETERIVGFSNCD